MSIWQKLVAVIAETEHSNRTIRAKGMEIATKTPDRAIRKKISMWWLHVDLLMQLTIKKDILDIKLRDRSMANKYHSEKCEEWSCGPYEQMFHLSHSHDPVESHGSQDELYYARKPSESKSCRPTYKIQVMG